MPSYSASYSSARQIQVCLLWLLGEEIQIVDHIAGDTENNSDDNLQIVCQMCNCVKHAGQGCVLKGVVELYRISWFSQNTLIILTRFLRDSGKSDEEIKKLLGFDEEVQFEMDREYLKPLFAFVTSRQTHSGNDMYDRWRNYHEQFLRPKYVKMSRRICRLLHPISMTVYTNRLRPRYWLTFLNWKITRTSR